MSHELRDDTGRAEVGGEAVTEDGHAPRGREGEREGGREGGVRDNAGRAKIGGDAVL
jgi:hypothetical protein